MNKNNLSKVYVLITAVRDEEKYIQNTIESVINQELLPKKWIIISDGSIDRTDEIVMDYERRHKFITLIREDKEKHRNFGSQVRAINTGIKLIRNDNFNYIGNLDADITLEYNYFYNLIKKFENNPRLGLAGGSIYEKNKKIYIERLCNSTTSVPHAIQLFRRECFENINGYKQLKYGGLDWYSEVKARMNAWHVESFKDLKVYHHKPVFTFEGPVAGGIRQGLMDYSMGSHPLFEILKCSKRILQKPYLLYAVFRFFGFLNGYVKKEQREVSKSFIKYLRNEQINRIKSLIIKS